MHKIVNGKKIELSDDEAKEMRSKWELEEEKNLKEKQQLELEIQMRESAKSKVLQACGLTEEEIKILFK